MGISADQLAKLLGVHPESLQLELLAYSFNDTKVLIGAPLKPLLGLEYVSARHLNPQTKRFQCLSGRGVFASNTNQAGIIEIGLLRGSPAQGSIELAQLSGIPYPIIMQDIASGGSSQVVATACQMTSTPEWKREAVPGVNVFTFETTRLFIAHGLQLPYLVV